MTAYGALAPRCDSAFFLAQNGTPIILLDMSDAVENVESVDTGGSTATGTLDAPVKSPQRTKQKPKKLPPYKVLLHNDDVNTIEHVIVSILKITSLTPEEALLRTLEAHETGVALLLTTHKERAELYQEQFLTFQITATIEPA